MNVNENIKQGKFDLKREVLAEEARTLNQKINNYQFHYVDFIVTIITVLLIFTFVFFYFAMKGIIHWNYIWGFAFISGVCIYYLRVNLKRLNNTKKLHQIKLEIANIESEELQAEIEDNFFTKLVQLNFKYLDKYYLQTQIQADKSFAICAYSSLFALLIICVGITLMFLSAYNQSIDGKSMEFSSYVVTAAGVLSQFIAAIFFYLYNQTILEMGDYHQKLVLTQNISLALKISEGLKNTDKQVESQQELIKELTKDVNFHLMNRSEKPSPKQKTES